MLSFLSLSSSLSRFVSSQPNSIVRGDKNDIILAGSWVDFIDAGGGNNTVVQLLGSAKILAGDGNDVIKTGFGNNTIDAGNGNNTVITIGGRNDIKTGSGNDYVAAGAGNDLIDVGDGDDRVEANHGDDTVYGGRGNDVIFGGHGNDTVFGDAAFIGESVSVDFLDAANWTANLAENGTQIRLDGATLFATGGAFAAHQGLGILSSNDATSGLNYPREIDAWNDTPESLRVSFDEAQSNVNFTLNRFLIEKLIIVEPELADLMIRFSDGSTATQLLKGTTDGVLTVNLDSADFGGREIAGFEVAPNSKLWEIVKATRPADYNSNHPFSEFTLASLTFEKDANAKGANNDKLHGGTGDDRLDGGWGDDKLYGEAGDDILNGGQSNNFMCGGSGRDTFVFDQRATSDNIVADFSLRQDKLQFEDGVSVASAAREGHDLVLTLNNGGTVTLDGLGNVSDWSLLV